MKIVILMGALTMGGAERVATTLASYLSKHNVETYLISLDNKASSYKIDSTVHFINNKDKKEEKRLGAIKQRMNFIFTELEKIKPDLIFTMFCKTTMYALIYKIIKNRNLKIVSSERCHPKSKDRKGLVVILNKFTSKRCDGFIFQTNRAREYYHKKVQKKGIVIHNAISNPLLEEVDSRDIRSEKLITSMGRLEDQKAQDIMIKAFEPIAKEYPEYKLVIYGEGSKRQELEKLVEKLQLQKQVFLPGNDEKAILQVAKSKIFLFTSRFEGMPNALMEAMALGIPAISTDCPMGPAELIENGRNGFLVAVDDEIAITNKIKLLLDNEKLATNISENSKEIKATHSIENIYNQYLEYFQKIVGEDHERKNF